MRVISNKTLKDFAMSNVDAQRPLQAWRKTLERGQFPHFASLKKTFNSVDRVSDFYVFDISGNKYRIITAIHFNTQCLYVRHIFTHTDYDNWKPPS